LLLTWAVMAAVASRLGVSAGMITVGSQVALVPTWFLAVYILVVLLVPLTRRAWESMGMGSFWALVAGAVLVDIAFFVGGLHALGWLNYLFVWLAVHQLGYAWRDGMLTGLRALPWVLVGLPALVALTHLGPYPVSLVGVPSEEISNTLPPKITLLALGAAQIGLLLLLEAPARRWLSRLAPWTATVLVNSMIMTVFLWHSTVMMLLVGLAIWVAPAAVGVPPGTAGWWAWRPLWVVVYAVASVPFLAAFSRFERPSGAVRAAPVWRLLVGCVTACLGLAMLALDGVGGEGWLGIRVVPLLLPFVGAGIAGFGPLAAVARRQ
jgi:hypothetical protein